MKNIITGLVAIGLVVFSLFALNESIKRHERVECQQWLKQSKEYPGFYWADWQVEQCRTLEVIKQSDIIKIN